MPDGKIFFSRAFPLVAFAFAAALSGCGGGAGPLGVADLPKGMVHSNFPKPHDYPVHGIDVSKFQGEIDWNAVASSGVKFAWIKATEGGDRADERFQANWTGAKTAGVPHGAYHFVYWCRPPMEEMAFLRAECAGRGRCAAAGPRRRGDADIEDLSSSSDARGRCGRYEGDAGGDGAPLRQAADHIYNGRLL